MPRPKAKSAFAIVSAASLLSSFTARNPSVLASEPLVLSAAADKGEPEQPVDTLHAMAVTGFQSVAGKLQWVRATEPFYVTKEVLIAVNDYVQLEETDAKRIRNAGRCEFATEEEVVAAQKTKKAA